MLELSLPPLFLSSKHTRSVLYSPLLQVTLPICRHIDLQFSLLIFVAEVEVDEKGGALLFTPVRDLSIASIYD